MHLKGDKSLFKEFAQNIYKKNNKKERKKHEKRSQFGGMTSLETRKKRERERERVSKKERKKRGWNNRRTKERKK